MRGFLSARALAFVGLVGLTFTACGQDVSSSKSAGVDALAAAPSAAGVAGAAPVVARSDEPLLDRIGALEDKRDPKCHATASRLEDFVFGTPLSVAGRHLKNRLQTDLALALWAAAEQASRAAGAREISKTHVDAALAKRPKLDARIRPVDLRHYGSIAYSLRALLAAEQRMQTGQAPRLLPLARDAIDALATAMDEATLDALAKADRVAREESLRELSPELIDRSWSRVAPPGAGTEAPLAPSDRLALLRTIVDRKVKSYAAYNEASNDLFVRNLQVYFARLRWPADPADAKRFQQVFTELLIAFASELYSRAQQVALAAGEPVISEARVHAQAQLVAPHTLDAWEDATFFPRLPRDRRVVIEAYDMDSFRDTGIHWRYLGFALDDLKARVLLPPDPFAAELLAENIAQYGVLLLREAGRIGVAANVERIAPEHLVAALESLRARAKASAEAPDEAAAPALASAPAQAAPGAESPWFTEVSAELGVVMEHRSADWLARLLRSYLPGKEAGGGNMTIPPAFGGSGIAAADVNGDGWPDLLILSGAGNRLYLNRAGKRFADVTERSGLTWVRPEDRRPGEPRQPLVADLDNDGDSDIVITYVDDPHRVYLNRGDGTFEDVTDGAGLGGDGLVGGPATVADFDGDGRLDVYIAYFGDYVRGVLPTLKRRNTNGLANALFRNATEDGDGEGRLRFEPVPDAGGAADVGWGQALTHTDLDGDGRQDLLVGNDFGVNGYYRNLGGLRFEDVAAKLGTDKPSYTMGFGLTDLNGDGRPDIYVSNIVVMNKDERYVLPGPDTPMKLDPDKLANARVVEANDLFVSSGDRWVASDAVGRGYARTGWAWDADFFDFDHDGDDDLYVLNGMNEFRVYSSDNPYYRDPNDAAQNVAFADSARDANVFFVNEGGKLVNRSAASGLDFLGNSRSAAYLDFDGDGDLDVAVNSYHDRFMLFRNDAPKRGRSLRVVLRSDGGGAMNRDAVGARLTVELPDGRKLWREVQGSIGYLSVHPREQHLGVGDAERVTLGVAWPDGRKTRVEVATGGRVIVTPGGVVP